MSMVGRNIGAHAGKSPFKEGTIDFLLAFDFCRSGTHAKFSSVSRLFLCFHSLAISQPSGYIVHSQYCSAWILSLSKTIDDPTAANNYPLRSPDTGLLLILNIS